jgi:hypothetical protein
MQNRRDRDDRRTDEAGQRTRIEGRRHRHERQIVAKRADLAEEAEEEVAVDAALVDLVEDDRSCSVEAGIRQEAAQEHTGGDGLDTGVIRDNPLAAHGESARPAEA